MYLGKIEKSENAGSRQESNLRHLACAASALPPSYDNHQPSQSSICTAQVVLKYITQCVCRS